MSSQIEDVIQHLERSGDRTDRDEVINMLRNLKTSDESKHRDVVRPKSVAGAPYTVRAPVGPMPGKQRFGGPTGTRSQEERSRALKYRFAPAHILVLTDGSEHAHKAMDAAMHHRRRNDYLYVLNCVQLAGEGSSFKEANATLQGRGEALIEDVRKEINEREIGRWECTTLPSDDARQAALDYAKKNNIDMIFIGSRGLDAKTGDFLPGSFSKYMIEHAECSVFLVR